MSNETSFSYLRIISRKGRNRCHVALHDMQKAMAALAFAAGNLQSGAKGGFPAERLGMQMKQEPKDLVFLLMGPFLQEDDEAIPDEVWFDIMPSEKFVASPTHAKIYSLKKTSGRVVSAIFSDFVDSWIKWQKRSNTDYDTWPSNLNFARVVRNALSHNGKISMGQNARPVKWRSLTYGPEHIGRNLLFEDFAPADLTVLMMDVDAELHSLEAPFSPYE